MNRGFLVTIAIFLFGSLVVVGMHAASWFLEDSKPVATTGSADSLNGSAKDEDTADGPPSTPKNAD